MQQDESIIGLGSENKNIEFGIHKKKSRLLIILAISIIIAGGIFTISSYSYYKIHFNRGVSFVKSKQYDQALVEFKKADRFTVPRDENLHKNLAITYFLLRDYNNAISTFNKILAFYPNNAELNKLLGNTYVLYSTKNEDKDLLKKAQYYLEKAYKLDPNVFSENDKETLETVRGILNS